MAGCPIRCVVEESHYSASNTSQFYFRIGIKPICYESKAVLSIRILCSIVQVMKLTQFKLSSIAVVLFIFPEAMSLAALS